MKFDPEHVVAEAQSFPSPRPANSEAEGAAAQRLADRLALPGWTVQKLGAVNSSARSWIWVLGSILCATAALAILVLRPVNALFGLVPAGLALFFNGMFGKRVVEAPSHVWLQHPAPSGEPRSQLLLVTRLDTPSARFLNLDFRVVLAILAVTGLLALFGVPGMKPALVGIVAGFSLISPIEAMLSRLLGPKLSQNDPRLGLSLLGELVSWLPASITEHLNVSLIAVGGGLFNQTSPLLAATLESIMDQVGSESRILMLVLDDPGRGKSLVVGASAGVSIVASASAKELWIPFEMTNDWPTHWDLPESRAVVRIASRPGPVEPKLVACAAQLATEIAMRWSRVERVRTR